MQTAAAHWESQGATVPDDVERKFYSMAAFCQQHDVSSVPDPYYGGPQGFEKVLDLLDDACRGLLLSMEQGAKR